MFWFNVPLVEPLFQGVETGAGRDPTLPASAASSPTAATVAGASSSSVLPETPGAPFVRTLTVNVDAGETADSPPKAGRGLGKPPGSTLGATPYSHRDVMGLRLEA